MRITYFYRENREGAFSIEGIFDPISGYLSQELIDISSIRVPLPSNKLSYLYKNVLFAFKKQGQLNHITGDIHYIALGLNRKNTILTVHDCVPLYQDIGFLKKTLIKYLWYKWPLKRLNHITVISAKTKRELVELIGCSPEKITVVPNCYNPIYEYSPKPFSAKHPVILQIGTKPNKNLQRLIPALKDISCRLEIIGKLSQEQLDLLEQNGIDYRTSQNLSVEELYAKYQQCDIVTFVSTYEGFGMPIIEANAVGRPVITSNISPMTEVAGGAAIFVEPHSIQSIRDAITKLMRDKALRIQLVEKGLQNARKYTIDNVANQYFQLYQKVISKS